MMRSIVGLFFIVVAAAPAIARPAPATPSVNPASLIEPVDAPHRNCGGACLKSGTLQWFCGRAQSCALSCATAPPRMLCADGR